MTLTARLARQCLALLPLRARLATIAAGVAAILLAPLAPAQAQNPFSAALWVNDSAITNYEIDQRRRFLEFIGAGGADPRGRAVERLIEDRLQIQEAQRLGLRLSPGQLNEAMAEFAARAEVEVDELLTRMRRDGIERETFVEFIRAGTLWREMAQGLFGPRVRITEAEIERAMSIENLRPRSEVLISEIFLPTDPQFAEAVAEIIPQILAITSVEEFGAAARQVSASPSADQGGRVDNWINVETIPEPLQTELRSGRTGRVIGPLEIPGAVGFFMLRASRETREAPAGQTELEFRRVRLPGGRSETNTQRVALIRTHAVTCADFGAVVGRAAPEIAPDAVVTETRLATELPAGMAAELARLNANQVSANQVIDGGLEVVMLCARRLVPDPRPSRAQVEQRLFNRALEQHAEVYLQRLRAEAEIRRN